LGGSWLCSQKMRFTSADTIGYGIWLFAEVGVIVRRDFTRLIAGLVESEVRTQNPVNLPRLAVDMYCHAKQIVGVTNTI
jgi:hypothetical protein